jgi:hypothetical protein
VLKYINTNTGLFWLAFFTTISFHGLNLASASPYREISVNDDTLDTKIASQLSHHDHIAVASLVVDKINVASSTTSLLSNTNQSDLAENPLQTPKQQDNLLGDIALNSNQNDSETTDDEQSNTNLGLTVIQIIALSFFLLLFVPFGIFYPFLLLYRNLLNVAPEESIKSSFSDDLLFHKSSIAANYNPRKQEQKAKATIYKLQIAGSDLNNIVRQKLAQINSNIELQTEQKVVELMRQNIAALLEQKNWSHASYSSLELPLGEIQTELDVISCTEKNKFLNQELSLINNGQSTQAVNRFQPKASDSYAVFTLIVCTSTPLPLFEQIYTKEQLTQELIKLNNLPKDYLLQFELLWNPQDEDEYISNDQLLMEYGDMIRLL